MERQVIKDIYETKKRTIYQKEKIVFDLYLRYSYQSAVWSWPYILGSIDFYTKSVKDKDDEYTAR